MRNRYAILNRCYSVTLPLKTSVSVFMTELTKPNNLHNITMLVFTIMTMILSIVTFVNRYSISAVKMSQTYKQSVVDSKPSLRLY